MELWPGHGFLVCAHSVLDLREMTFRLDHDTPFGHGQQNNYLKYYPDRTCHSGEMLLTQILGMYAL